jgi:poly-gamma-glutamate synthesis protein (capsule biosynthesis protein)
VVEAARAGHDLVIVVLHWGDEYEDAPQKWQVRAARAFVDAGADAVIAHHPHVLQGIERYGDGLIAYSIGNFVFDNLHGRKRLHGIVKLTFRRDGDRACLERGAFHPTVGTRPRFTPKPAGKEFDKVAERLRALSAQKPLRATEWTIDAPGQRLLVEGGCRPSRQE